MRYAIRFVFVLLTLQTACIFHVSSALACNECEYRDGLLHVCLPKGGCIINQLNPIMQLQNSIGLAQAIASGDSKQITQALGNSLMNSPACLMCASVVHNALPKLSDSQINQIVGEGAITFAATGDPYLVVVDVGKNVITEQPIRSASHNSPAPPAPPVSRKEKLFSGVADCIIQYKDGMIYAGWKTFPPLTDVDGATSIVPNIDLAKGDTINLTAHICSEWSSPSEGWTSLPTASLRYEDQKLNNGGPDVVKFFLYGPHL